MNKKANFHTKQLIWQQKNHFLNQIKFAALVYGVITVLRLLFNIDSALQFNKIILYCIIWIKTGWIEFTFIKQWIHFKQLCSLKNATFLNDILYVMLDICWMQIKKRFDTVSFFIYIINQNCKKLRWHTISGFKSSFIMFQMTRCELEMQKRYNFQRLFMK